METACYLAGLGSSVSVVVRSKILRSFDQQVVRHLEEKLSEEDNMNILIESKVKQIHKMENGKMNVDLDIKGKSQTIKDVDCVVLAVGRSFQPETLGLDKVKEIKLNPQR
jgi:pyruvate/2-oxoglutarate dehydrogenase complex dihydrolipoamide dehydrogenase (E3) component